MSDRPTQAGRPIRIDTPLGEDALLLRGFTGREELSRPFRFELDLLSEDDGITETDIVGENVKWSVNLASSGEPRTWNGFVSNFTYLGKGDRLSMYRATVVPWLWVLTRRSDCRIFQNKNVEDVIKDVVKRAGFGDRLQFHVQQSLPVREYVVQYRETDFNFINRLMEHAGLFYFFVHEDGKEVMHVADHRGVHQVSDDGEVKFQASGSKAELERSILDWNHGYEYRSGKWTHKDYNFKTPDEPLLSDAQTKLRLKGADKHEFYDYPGEYFLPNEGDQEVKHRMEEEEAGHDVVSGRGTARAFAPGQLFSLTDHHSDREASGYLLTSVTHRAQLGGAYVTEGGGGSHRMYENSFTAVPDNVAYRPVRRTPKPIVAGCQTAKVTGPSGEEIYPDEYGRVKVKFPWDRHNPEDETSSCWIRVSTPWAGTNWGSIAIPRVGQEVVVSFLEGNPDRPLITGMVYNANNMPPYGLPENKTQSGIKTRSSKDGSGDNFNEFRFEDKKGEEEVYLHAEKDMNRVVENDETHCVGYENQLSERQLKASWDDMGPGSKFQNGNRHILLRGSERVELEQGDQFFKVKNGARGTFVYDDDIYENQMGNRESTIKGGDDTLEVKTGNRDIKIALGKQTTEAMQSIELKVGSSSIKLDQTGIKIKAPQITLEAQTMLKAKGTMTTVEGSAITNVKGGLVKIN